MRGYRLELLWASILLTSLLGSAQQITKSNEGVALLEKGKPVIQTLRGADAHSYRIVLETDQFVRVTVAQRGIDIVLTVFGPGNKKIEEIDKTGSYGPEVASVVAKNPGEYRFEVRALDPSAGEGQYEIKMTALLSAEQFRKVQPVAIDRRLLDDYAGNYRLASNRIITLGIDDEMGGRLFYYDSKTNRFGVLHPLSDTTFFSGKTLGDDLTIDIKVQFLRGKRREVSALRWQEKNERSVTAARVFPYRNEHVAFQNGNVTLKGNLVLPADKGPHPVIVIAHGSGSETRNIWFFNYIFLRASVGVLAFDKRGSGQSTGSWQTSSLEDLAADILAGVQMLKGRHDIDPKKIGIFGMSQGGWVGSIAAAQSKDIGFLMIRVGSGLPVAENIVYENEGNMRQAGFDSDQIAAASAVARKAAEMASDGEDWKKIHALFQKVENQPWADFTFPASLPKSSFWFTWFKKNGHIDPSFYLRRVHCPVLWFLGELDKNVPSAESEIRIKAALRAGGNSDYTVKTLKHADHGLIESRTGFLSDDESATRYVPGYWDTMLAWLRRRLKDHQETNSR